MAAYGLHDVRSTLLRNWDPLYVPIPAKERDNLRQLWRELIAVEAVDAWKSISTLSGQLIEALLRYRLLADQHYDFSMLSGKTLGKLIYMAREAGLLPDYEAAPSAKASISTALTLRNWASHAALWYDYPTDIRATQSLALAICTVESLFPKSSPSFVTVPELADSGWWIQLWEHGAPGMVVGELIRAPNSEFAVAIKSEPSKLYRHVLQYGTAGSVAKLLKLVYDWNLQQDEICTTIHIHFADLVRNASRSSFKFFLDVVWRLRMMDLDPHAQVFSILLPFDPAVFKSLLETQSPAWVARYVSECFRAEPVVFKVTASDLKKMAGVIKAFWARFGAGSGNILNMANILASMPYELRIAVLQEAPKATLLQWIRDSEPRNSVNLLGSLSDRLIKHAPHLASLRDEVLVSFTERVRGKRPEEIEEIPLRLKRFKVANETVGVRSLTAVLETTEKAAVGECDWAAVRRIVWDCYNFCKQLAPAAAQLASYILSRHGLRIPLWHRLCLLGVIEVHEAEASRMTEIDPAVDEIEFINKCRETEIDRWQKFLAALSYGMFCQRRGLPLPAEGVKILRDLLVDTTMPDEDASRQLISKVGELFSLPG